MATQCDSDTRAQSGAENWQEHAALLRSLALLLSSHLRYTGDEKVPTTSQECLQQQQTELPLLFASSPDDATMAPRVCCSVPCLQLRQQKTNLKGKSCCGRPSEDTVTNKMGEPTAQASSAISLEHNTAQSLGRRITVTRDELSDLPHHILTNFTATFETLWQARIRQAVKALVSRGSTAFDAIHARLLAKVATQPPSAVVSTFKSLDFVDRCNAPADAEDTQMPWIVIPVIFEVVMDWTLFFDPSLTVSTSPMQAPGVLQGQFSTFDKRLRLESVDLELDTKSLLGAMMTEVKLLVRKAMLVASHQTRQKVGTQVPIVPSRHTGSLDLLSRPHKRMATSLTTTPVEPTLDAEIATVGSDETNDELVDDEQEGMAEAALILAAKTPLQTLFETETLEANAGDDGAPNVERPSTMYGTPMSPTTGMAENPNMPPPPKRAPSVDALLAPDAVLGHSSRKRSASG